VERLRDVPACDACRELSTRNKHLPKCEDPDREDCVPPLDPANRDAYAVWARCRQQFIMGFGGPIDINHLSIWRLIDELKIRNRLDCFEKVSAAAHAEIAAILEDQENRNSNQ